MASDPSQRLRSDSEERYAQERAFGYLPFEAARRAALNPRNGAATKYEAKPRVNARIAYLRRDDLTDEMREAKRRHLEDRLELAAFADIFDCSSIGEDGDPTIDWRMVAERGLSAIISEFRFDKDTGRLVQFKRDDALAAIAQLRDMRGFKAATKTDLMIRTPNQMTDDELANIAASGGAGANPAPLTP